MDWSMALTEIAEHAEWDAGGLGKEYQLAGDAVLF